MDNKAITITFGDRAENHVGMQQIGKLADHGFTHSDLIHFANIFNEYSNVTSTIYDLKELSGLSDNPNVPNAYILIINNAVNEMMKEFNSELSHNDLFQEQLMLPYDKKAFMRGRVVNKHARWNLCFSDFSQEPDYENKKGTIINFEDIPLTNYIKHKKHWNWISWRFGKKKNCCC